MRASGTNAMSRAANSSSSAADVSGDGGTGDGSGITNVIRHCSRTPRATSSSCSSSAHSLGAGGHLNGAPHTPMTAWPDVNDGRIPASRAAPATE